MKFPHHLTRSLFAALVAVAVASSSARAATIAQQAYLKASNNGTGDAFGWSVAMSGDTLVVGAYQEDSNATGVNGNQANNSLTRAGAAYVFVREGTNWIQQAYLKRPTPATPWRARPSAGRWQCRETRWRSLRLESPATPPA